MKYYPAVMKVKDLELKSFQTQAIVELKMAMSKHKRVILQAACSFGKTVLAAQVVKQALAKNNKVLFIVHRIILAEQATDLFHSYGIPAGLIQSNNPRFNIDQPVQVCSVATLRTRGCPGGCALIIIDECHVLTETHKKIMKDNPDSYIIGLSATPFTKGLGKHFETHIQPYPMKQLITEGYLCPYIIYGPTIADLSKLKVVAGEYTEASLSSTFDKADIVGDVVKTWLKLTPNKKTIIFCVNVAHGKHLSAQFCAAGIKADQVNAYESSERDVKIKEFMYGETMVLCSVEILVAGFDYPGVEVCAFALSTKSPTKWIQATGRALRLSPGKEQAVILDFGGNAERLGFPDDFQFDILDDGKKKKSESTPKPKLPKVCPSCAYLKPVGVNRCPACGLLPERKPEIEVAEGDLTAVQRRARKEYSVAQKQYFLSQLNHYAANHGMKQGRGGCFGWSLYSYKAKFGCDPSSGMNWGARLPVTDEVSRWIAHRYIKFAKGRELSIKGGQNAGSQAIR